RRRTPGVRPRRQRRRAGADRTDRVPPAALLHDPPRARLLTRATAGSCVGRQRVRRGTHGRRAHPAPAQDTGAAPAGRHDPDRARRRLPVLGLGLTSIPDTAAMPPHARSAWLRTLGLLALCMAAAALLGLAVGHPWPVVTLAAFGVLGWHYWRLR